MIYPIGFRGERESEKEVHFSRMKQADVSFPPPCVISAKAGIQAPLCAAPVSFLRKRQSSTPLPTAGEAGGAEGTAG
jgi:hypothetical protein